MTTPLGPPMRLAFRWMTSRGLAGVWLRGELPRSRAVWAANHHSWWDPFLAATLLGGAGQRPSLVMRADNLTRFPYLRQVEVFGHDQPRRGLELLRAGRVLIVFPEGELRPAGPPGPVAPGAAWYAIRSGAPLCSAAVRLLMRGRQHPEAFVTVRPVDATGTLAEVTDRLAAVLAADLAEIDAANLTTDPRRPLPGWRLAARGRRGADERATWRRPEREPV
ncbi:1-acyl-sn-glycerol-3-phosphate acyltransferase [Pilimelia columellifera]|uniref:1-acyl-sn-glycerol-3-phosphate acyltransferase n=1 Tax=Pilimelia columellifera subsp. columellifera TaxID=706583 RepID=A0ABP6ADR4_9ACTN